MPRLFLLDGTALAYRSHFALARSGLSRTDGRPTGATYGFTMALRRILETESPDAIAVALDAKGPTFRHEQYAEKVNSSACQVIAEAPILSRFGPR